MTKNTENTETTSKPKLLLRATSNKPITTTTPFYLPTSPIASGVFILPIKQKTNRKGRNPPKKHLRKPPSFDTYIRSSATATTPTLCSYRARTVRAPSVSSSYSSTSSLLDNDFNNNNNEEDMMFYGYGSQRHGSVSSATSASVNRHRRASSAFKVRFAETSDDGSSIVSSSSSSVDEWDDMEEEDEEEEYIFVRPSSQQQPYFSYLEKSDST